MAGTPYRFDAGCLRELRPSSLQQESVVSAAWASGPDGRRQEVREDHRGSFPLGGAVGNENPERRLAAIVAADVAGYSRLMEQDEAGTLAALKQRRRDILNPLLARHRGRIVKLMGDGVLAEFGSVVN